MTKFNNPLKTMSMLQKIRMEQAVLKHQISNFSIPVRGNVTAHQNTDQTF